MIHYTKSSGEDIDFVRTFFVPRIVFLIREYLYFCKNLIKNSHEHEKSDILQEDC